MATFELATAFNHNDCLQKNKKKKLICVSEEWRKEPSDDPNVR